MMHVLAAEATPNDALLLWGFILLAAALALLFLELLLPSGGLIAMLCGVAVIGSIIAFFNYETRWGLAAMALYIVLIPITVIFFFKYWLNSRYGRRMILGGDSGRNTPDESYAASEQARNDRLADLTALIGIEGVAVTSLRPVGTVKIEGRRLDALAESGTIEANTRVVVSDVYDNQIKVRPAS
jgi:membrane-bound serine protease (ClpP class)